MASDVDVCNLALSHIGDTANVASINPPDGSVQSALPLSAVSSSVV